MSAAAATPTRLQSSSSAGLRARGASGQWPAAKRHFSRRIWPQTPRGSLGSLDPLGSPGSYVYAHMHFLSPHLPGLLPIVCDGQHRPVRRWPLFGRNRPFASWGGGTLKRVKISRFQIDASLTDSFALRRASSRGDSYTSPVVVVGRLAITWYQRPAASGQTTLLSEHLAANPARLAGLAGSAGLAGFVGLAGLVRVCTHAFSFPSSAWPASHRLRRPAPTGSAMAIFLPKSTFRKLGGGGGGTLKRVKISRFQIDASFTDFFALRRPSSRGDSYTSPFVVVGLLASTWCQRPNDTSLGASGRKPRAARWARWLRWARRARTCMHTCVFFPLICLTCFPSSATASTDRFGDGHFSSEIDLSQAWGVR